MPELPEVETTCRGILPHIIKRNITKVTIRQKRLRWEIPVRLLQQQLLAQPILGVSRRAKYILIELPTGVLIIHLGMSGTLRITSESSILQPHDHFVCTLNNGKSLRLNDPRRFGCVLWAKKPEELTIFQRLGPEPLSTEFNANYLHNKARKRQIAIKNFIMNNHIVVGVGNIYASESLFLAQIHPEMSAAKLTLEEADKLCRAIRKVLKAAIKAGGTTLKDFYNSEGKPGYFSTQLKVYGKTGEPCEVCERPIFSTIIGQRTSYFCGYCQVKR